MRRLWMTFLLLSVTLVTLVAPTYVQGETGVFDERQTISTTASADNFSLSVDPRVHTIHHLKNEKVRSAIYAVRVMAVSGFRGKVELSIQGLPQDAEAFFYPVWGVPRPVFVSILRVLVQPSTPAHAYNLTVIGSSGEASNYATVALIVEGEAVPSTEPRINKLRVSVSTDKENYQRGDAVEISGYVKLVSGGSVSGATISLSVLDSSGREVHATATNTNQAGRYFDSFTLPQDAADGTYTVYVTASMASYKDSYATLTFTVGVSSLASVRIVNATITALDGTASSEFQPGQTIVIWTAANNTGADLVNGNIWVEVLDPNDSPIAVVVVVVTIHTGEQAQIGVRVILSSNAVIGTYTVRILVSDRPIMTGGKFLDSDEIAFIVSSEPSTTTTSATTSETTSTTTEITSTTTSEVTSTTTSEIAATTTESTSTSTTETTHT